MTVSPAGGPTTQKPLRLWMGGVAVLLWFLRFVLPIVVPEAIAIGLLGGVLGALAVIVWWAVFSAAPRSERWGAVVLSVAALLAAWCVIDKSIATGHMGFTFPLYAIPILGISFAIWASFGHLLTDRPRRATMIASILLSCGVWTLLRTNGIAGASSDFAWRWSKTHEQVLVEQSGGRFAALPVAPAPLSIPEERRMAVTAKAVKADIGWPGFRGPRRDGIIPGIRIQTDWAAAAPVELWRRPIGPGWSSFAVAGDLLYTQEQRGEDEIVACYDAKTGNPVWAHRDRARFWESNAGAGPRGTPTLHGGRVYTLGATGIVNALNAGNGAVVWSRDAAADTGARVPGWGFASSPLVVGDMVIFAASGTLAAYDAAIGAPRWYGPDGGTSYSSPQLLKIDGVEQIVLLSAPGASSFAPADGTLLWKHSWPSSGTRIMQPAMTEDGGLLISGGDGMGGSGLRRLAVTHGADG